ncbi:helix-turn-helix domain-containing protein [Acidobacteria bacterium AH-259-G07]|nr:helix-turn-helix domain-containing protein [Acidobacteria bacterium AH-259-G07]
MKVSQEFLIRLKLNALPAYKIAQQAGVQPNTLSKLINGIEPVKPDDPRILKVAKVLGLSKQEVFEEATETG